MTSFLFKHVCIESIGVHLPTHEVTSSELEDRMAALYKRLHIPLGTLEKLSGISTRYLWDKDTRPSDIATVAARKALSGIGFDAKEIGVLFNCSVTRDFFEPATATIVHHNLGISENAFALDITNACVGFSNGISLLGTLIESGVVKAGLLVSGEAVTRIIDHCLDKILQDTSLGRERLLRMVPTLTLGSGAVAYVLCHDSIATNKHRVIGSVARTASEFNDLCSGNTDCAMFQETDDDPVMETDAAKLIYSANLLGARAWKEASEVFGWKKEDVDHIFCHQVGKQVNEAFYETLGLQKHKEFTIYQKYGNLVSAAMPTALALGVEERSVKEGDKIVLLGFGSGLQSIFTGLVW